MLKKYTKEILDLYMEMMRQCSRLLDIPYHQYPLRFPFKEYHTDQDKPEKLSEKSLGKLFNIVLKTIEEVLEKNFTLSCNHKGLLCLSNKKYDLYKDTYSLELSIKLTQIKNEDGIF